LVSGANAFGQEVFENVLGSFAKSGIIGEDGVFDHGSHLVAILKGVEFKVHTESVRDNLVTFVDRIVDDIAILLLGVEILPLEGALTDHAEGVAGKILYGQRVEIGCGFGRGGGGIRRRRGIRRGCGCITAGERAGRDAGQQQEGDELCVFHMVILQNLMQIMPPKG